jgi:hypothetical protein
MKIKHILYLFLLFLLVSVGANTASAQKFNLDLTNIDGNNYGSYNDIYMGLHNGTSDLHQSFSGSVPSPLDGYFSNGDLFSESTFTSKFGYTTTANQAAPNFFNGLIAAGKHMYIYAENLTGYVYDVVTPGDVSSAFKYNFFTGAGESIGVYIGDVGTEPGVGDFKIASIDLIEGQGQGADGFNATNEVEGTTRLAGFLNPTQAGIFSIDGYDLFDLPASMRGIVTLTSTNKVADFALLDLNPEDFSASGFDAEINNTGQIKLYLTPEPGTMLLLGFGLLGLAGISRKKFLKKD